MVSGLARAEVLERVVKDREVMTHADLQDYRAGSEFFPDIKKVVLPEPRTTGGFLGKSQAAAKKEPPRFESYDFYVAVLVKASLKRTREVLTNYQVYSELVPYISRAEFFPASKMLHVEGGIWKYRINSRIRFEERGERWIRYRIVSGHFRGMLGEIVLEPLGDGGKDGTLVFMYGQSIANRFPPAFVIEQGAQVVFGFTANRIRTFIESGKVAPDVTGATELPVNCLKAHEESEQPPECASQVKKASPIDVPRSGGTKDHDSEIPVPRRRF